MSGKKFMDNLVAEPLAYRLPCADCKWSRTTTLENFRDQYVACGWSPETPYWTSFSEAHRLKTNKEVYGPFADDAKPIECKTFEAI